MLTSSIRRYLSMSPSIERLLLGVCALPLLFPWAFWGPLHLNCHSPLLRRLSTLCLQGLFQQRSWSNAKLFSGSSPEERPPCLRWWYLLLQVSPFLGAWSLALFSPKSLECYFQTPLWFDEQSVQKAWPAQSICSPSCVLYQGSNTSLTSCAFAQTDVMIFMQKQLRSSSPHDAAN